MTTAPSQPNTDPSSEPSTHATTVTLELPDPPHEPATATPHQTWWRRLPAIALTLLFIAIAVAYLVLPSIWQWTSAETAHTQPRPAAISTVAPAATVPAAPRPAPEAQRAASAPAARAIPAVLAPVKVKSG